MPGQKRKKNYYANAAKKARAHGQGRVLASDMKGFLLTCNNREKEAVREAYNLFNEYADKIFGPENKEESKEESETAKEDEDDVDDIDAAFDKEKAGLVAVKAKAERRFQMVDSGANNCVFIKTTLQDPSQVVNAIVCDIFATKEAKARFILRLLPVLGTCKAYDKNMIELAESCLEKYFVVNKSDPSGVDPSPNSPSTSQKSDAVAENNDAEKSQNDNTSAPSYAIVFKTRNNNQVKRDDVIASIGKVVKNLSSEATVEFKNPDICIVIEIIRNICCLSVVENFYKYKKYNLVELAKEEAALENKPEDGDNAANREDANGNDQDNNADEIVKEVKREPSENDKEETKPSSTIAETSANVDAEETVPTNGSTST